MSARGDGAAFGALKLIVALCACGLLTLAFAPELLPERLPSAVAGASWLGLATLAVRVFLWLGYRPVPPCEDDALLPSLTVVVPAYNEGAGVAETLASLLASRYPADRLTVIAVNDGSRDDTGVHLDRARAALGARLTVVHLPENRGKRHALHAGLSLASTDFVATVDSDSRVAPDTLRHLVAPFGADPRTAAVAGQVRVWNRRHNLLTRMLFVRYLLGFDFIRAYQSQLATVWCCPGALQCYRLGVIRPHLDAWRDQRFLGARCNNGDDHALTTLVLSLGHDARFQQSATVETMVPTRYADLCRMYVRWGRSATRESLRALPSVPRRLRRLGPVRGALMAADALLQPASILARVAAVPASLWLLATDPVWLLRGLAAGSLFGVLYGALYLRSERSNDALYGLLYGWFALFTLWWIQPFATLTVRSNRWLTRGNPPSPQPALPSA
jgi:hyaluronan synthase